MKTIYPIYPFLQRLKKIQKSEPMPLYIDVPLPPLPAPSPIVKDDEEFDRGVTIIELF